MRRIQQLVAVVGIVLLATSTCAFARDGAHRDGHSQHHSRHINKAKKASAKRGVVNSKIRDAQNTSSDFRIRSICRGC